jgi:transmembrane sensor
MNSGISATDGRLSAALVAEAAAWLAILHGPNRTADVEKSFSKWLKASAHHSRAFEEATQIWEDSARMPRPTRLISPRARTSVAHAALALAAGVVLAIGCVLAYFRYSGVSTEIGEQRTLALEDGSRIVLNTATRVVVSYGSEARRVELKSGEALFEVARDPDRPFIVTAGSRQIRALGTAFLVRHEAQRVTVTMVEGKVAVQQANAQPKTATILVAGQRLTVDADAPATVDHPALDRALAWQRREIALDDTPLPEAVAEMNRYSERPLVIERPEAARVHVTGLFRAGDSLSFARAVAEAYRLEVVELSDRIAISGIPRSGSARAVTP